MSAPMLTSPIGSALRKPRLGFAGLGWIGRARLDALAEAEVAEVAGVYDPSRDAVQALSGRISTQLEVASWPELLDRDLDGVVIATPNDTHASLCEQALGLGIAVFCQKPLGRTLSEVQRVVAAAQAADRLLGVDFSYRYVRGVRRMQQLINDGSLGRVFALDLVFHNAYGPDKPWFYNASQSGGGCLLDLGVHLVDLAYWLTDARDMQVTNAELYAGGERLVAGTQRIEDYATATLELDSGMMARLACSWNLHAGQDAVIEVHCHGTSGGASLRNVNGSFHDFTLERYAGTSRELLCSPPDAWGARALVHWTRLLAASPVSRDSGAQLLKVAAAIDAMYGRV